MSPVAAAARMDLPAEDDQRVLHRGNGYQPKGMPALLVGKLYLPIGEEK
jgi:hypothetical protein